MSQRYSGGPLRPAVAVLALLGAVVIGCGQRGGMPTDPLSGGPAEILGKNFGATPAVVDKSSDCSTAILLDPRDFAHSTSINNRFYPLRPGRQYVLEGRADRGGGVLPHRVVFTVTDLVKEIDGVKTVVLWDRDFSDGQLVEAELAFQAQDNYGNVWNLGEYPEEYDAGVFTGAPNTWISGLFGSKGGILVNGDPRLGDKFLQGVAPEIAFLDCAKVYKTGENTCVPTGCYENVLVIAERSPLEPGSGKQFKYYAPGVGNVQIGAVGDKEGETLVLVEVTQLTPLQMLQAREEALKLEARAYQVSETYKFTPPMQ